MSETLEKRIKRLEVIILQLAPIALQGTGSLYSDLRAIVSQLKEACPNCGSDEFAIARDMNATRHCACGGSWEPGQ